MKIQVEGYSLLKEIGRGSFATVYLAKKSPTDQSVALKLAEGELGATLKSLKQMWNEFTV